MNKKWKRSDFHIDIKKTIAELKLEQGFRMRVYKRKVEEGKMNDRKANERYLITQELLEVAQLCKQKGINSIDELKTMLQDLPNRVVARQEKIQFPN
jgi:hypothetical protein